jgi:hypothetical protein
MVRALMLVVLLACCAAASRAAAQSWAEPPTYRLYEGITAYVNNPDGRDFTVTIDVRDVNIYANGPREVLFKVYDPDGRAVVREVIPDDGIVSKNYLPRIGGWDHELQYYAFCYGNGSPPMVRWGAPSDPKRLAAVEKRTFVRRIEGGRKGIYRVLLTGERDHYVTLKLDPALSYGVCGHHAWLHGQGGQWRTSYIYVPRGTTGMHLGLAEPDMPRTRRFTLTAPDGRKLFDGMASGIFTNTTVKFNPPGAYDDKVLKMEVSDGPNDYLVHVLLQRVEQKYEGMGTYAVFAPDERTARALQGGALYHDGQVFWHMFQVRFHDWLKVRKPDADLDKDLRALELLLRAISPGDGPGTPDWTNWGYSFGYYGTKVWRPSWLLMQRGDVPQEAKEIIREGVILCGDRLSFAAGMERVNGNAFAQIPVALWYCQAATGDKLNKERYNVYFDRFRTEGWGEGAGISKSGDCQEHFTHDSGYGSYIIDNWVGRTGGGGTWVPDGILADTDDPRFQETFNRILNVFSHVACRDANAYPWNGRINDGPVEAAWKNLKGPYAPKCDPGPDLTTSVNGGDEWFAARRKGYYVVTFHGRLAPAWLSNLFWGQLGFGGGIICQLTVPGKGAVLASGLAGQYGKGMDLPNWRNFHIHSIVGEMEDGRPLVAGVSEHLDARIQGNVVTSSGEVRDRPVRSSRKYTFENDSIACEVQLAPTGYEEVLTLWSPGRTVGGVKEAYEMIPFVNAKVTAIGADGREAELTTAREARTVVIDRGGYGVRIELEKPMKVMRGARDTVLIQLVDKPTPAGAIALKYRLVPFGA